MARGKSYDVKYEDELIFENLIMTEIPYKIVDHYMNYTDKNISFDKFKGNFIKVKEIISGRGNTEFLLEEKNIGDEEDTSNTRRRNYIVDKRPLLEYKFEGEIIKFGVYTQWKNNDDNSNFAKFIKVIKELGYYIEVNEIDLDINKNKKVEKEYHIETICNFINNKGFIYKKEELSNFYLSLKTKPFVILAGISGTGKSKLVRLFAESINAKFKSIPVKPDWNDSTELLGYKNIKDEFVRGELYKVIIEANDNLDTPYFVCLDEMNLARGEYYLSEYLSVIESRKFETDRIVTDQLFSEAYFENIEGNNISIPENLYIIGTVNMDDTTFAFSRKVLDRANTIEFSEVDLESLDFLTGEAETLIVDNSLLKTQFLNIKDALEIDRPYVEEINKKIVEINNILKPYSKHFGYRVRDEIVFYMLENKLSNLLEEDMAFDYQIMQKILPTIIGSDVYIEEILIELFEICTSHTLVNKENYIKEAESVVNNDYKKFRYPKSATKILQMLKGYRDGFVSFWQ